MKDELKVEGEILSTCAAWTTKQLARAAYLAGAGQSTSEIAADAEIQSTITVVRLNLNAAGLRVPAENGEKVALVLTQELAFFEQAAQARNLTTTQLIALIVEILAKEPTLINAILDDDAP